jgi:hypothetical protein
MQKKFLAIAVVALIAAAESGPVRAQDVLIGPAGVEVLEDRRGPPRRDRRDRYELSEREAIRIARREGLREVDDVERTRRSYRVIGVDRRGRDILVEVDRRNGEVIRVR